MSDHANPAIHVRMKDDDLAVIADLASIPVEKVRGIVWLAEKHVRETDGPPLPDVVRTARAHSDHLIRQIRNIAQNFAHTSSTHGAKDSHIHEPTTGGERFCGPCHAWRILNGSPEAYENGSDREATP